MWLGVVLTSIQRSRSDYVTVAKVLKDNLLFGGKIAGSEHENDIAEGDIFQDIQEVRVATISTTVYGEEIFTVMCGATLIQKDDRTTIGGLQSKVWKPGIMQEIKAVEYEQ